MAQPRGSIEVTFGFILLVGCGAWTVYILADGWSPWCLATGFLAVFGLGMMTERQLTNEEKELSSLEAELRRFCANLTSANSLEPHQLAAVLIALASNRSSRTFPEKSRWIEERVQHFRCTYKTASRQIDLVDELLRQLREAIRVPEMLRELCLVLLECHVLERPTDLDSCDKEMFATKMRQIPNVLVQIGAHVEDVEPLARHIDSVCYDTKFKDDGNRRSPS